MSSIDIRTLKKDEASLEALKYIFNYENNPKFCAVYGGGSHCNDARIMAKYNLWGGRGDAKPDGSCMTAKIAYVDNEAMGFLNVGISGNPPTVLDRTHEGKEGFVYELSGLGVTDDLLLSDWFLVGSSFAKTFANCLPDSGYTKGFVSYSTANIQQEFFMSMVIGGPEKMAAHKLSSATQANLLGENSLHPERFQITENGIKECAKWDTAPQKVSHEGWADSDACTQWVDKYAVVFDLHAQQNIDLAE